LFSILKTALATSSRRLRLLYANHDRASAIFGGALDTLAARYADRFVIEYHEDVVHGFVNHDEIARFLAGTHDAVHHVCGPDGFMNTVETALRARGVEPSRVRTERFTPAALPPPPAAATDGVEVTVSIGGRTVTARHREGASLLQTARFAGLRPPSSCEAGGCATCMARVVRGRAVMRHNDALTDDEIAEGWVLTCQAEPVTASVEVIYE
jgi:ferredoxin-NADP reductase